MAKPGPTGETLTPPAAEKPPELPAATPEPEMSEKDMAPGHRGYIDETPTISVTCDHDGFSPSAGVMLREGSHPYTHEEAAAIVSAGLGKVSKRERATLEAKGLLTPLTETKE